MPAAVRTLTCDRATEIIAGSCRGEDQRRVGVELEWLTVDAETGGQPELATLEAAAADAGPQLHGSRLTFEPGGQVELSTPAIDGVDACIALAATDAAALTATMASHGVELRAIGGPLSGRRRIVDTARYRAMESYFERLGPAGTEMMRGTASIQVNVDIGDGDLAAARWRVAHAVGPTLVAAFANSPTVAGGKPIRSARMAVWLAIDPTRAGPATANGEPGQAWATYALAANVMLMRATAADDYVALDRAFPLQRWIDDGHELGYPTEDDLSYHLTTLFPPVRPRGWLELRMIDMLPDPWWQAAGAVVFALLRDADSVAAVADATRRAVGCWREAVVDGLSHPALAASARACMETALETLSRDGAAAATQAAVAEYADTFTFRGRSPADDVLDAGAAARAPRVEVPAWI